MDIRETQNRVSNLEKEKHGSSTHLTLTAFFNLSQHIAIQSNRHNFVDLGGLASPQMKKTQRKSCPDTS